MFRSIWRSVDRFSLQYFKYLIDELQQIKIVDESNREAIVDILQSIVEIVTYGDKHDPSIFECFMEHQVLAEFVRVVKMSRNSKIEESVLQYLSIMMQNLRSEHAIYYCFSNGYINNIITHEYEFNVGDLALYYVSFLRAVSAKLSKDTLCLLVKVQEGAVTSFPLYTEAVRFAHHGEKMIQTAIRCLTLSIYNVCDDMVYKFLMTPPASEYFTDIILKLREECIHLDATICNIGDSFTSDKKKDLQYEKDKLLDDLYYIKDLLSVGKSCLDVLVTQKLLGLLVVPIMIPLMQFGKNTVVNISPVTSLYLLSCLLQVVDRKEILDSVASLLLYPHVASGAILATEADAVDSIEVKPSSEQLNNIEQVLYSSLKSDEIDKDKLLGNVLEHKLTACHFFSCQSDNVQERKGILSYVFSDNQSLLLSSLMLLLVLAESSDLDNYLASVFGFPQTKFKSNDIVVSTELDGSAVMRCMPQILNALFKILGSASTTPVPTQWHVGWFVLKLISLQGATLSHQDLQLFNVSVRLNTSFHQARECLLIELSGCWFDYIPDTFKKEWTSCKTALEESARNKDLFSILEFALHNESLDGHAIDVWQRMVDAVKIFVLHLLLRAHIKNGCLPNCPLRNLTSNSLASPRSIHVSDASSAKFGSQVPIGSGVPCQIAISKVGVRDIFMIPVAKGTSGKLLLVEKHPFHPRNGTVLAIAPLAGLNPKIDEEHLTWLHLRIRDFTPKPSGRRGTLNSSNHETDARWTLGFSDAEACETARFLIAEETNKQRSSVESLLAPFLYDNYLGEEADSQGEGAKITT